MHVERANSAIPLSILDVVNVREGQNYKMAFDQSVLLAQQSESLNFKRFWLAEHHNMPSIASTATCLLIQKIASETNHISVGSGGIMLPNHSPLSVAENFGTLYHLYPDRIELGLGRAPGTDGATAAALRKNNAHFPYDFEESINELMSYFEVPIQDRKVRSYISENTKVPFWILGSSIDSAYLAAKMGLPYAFAAHFAPAQFIQAANIYKNNFRPSDSLKEPYLIACVNVIAANSDDEALLLSTTIKKMFFGIITNSRNKMAPPDEEWIDFYDERLDSLLQQMLHFTFIGSEKKIQTELFEFINHSKADELMITNYIYDLDKRFNSLKILNNAM